MSGARLAWVLACICSSAVVAAPGQGASDPVVLELDLARRGEVYLVLEADGRSLSVRARGMELDAVPLLEVRAAWLHRAGDPLPPTPPGGPQVWRITEAPADSWRRVVAPEVLVPYVEDGEASAQPAQAGQRPASPPFRPDRYAVATDSPWRLAVATSVDAVVPLGCWRRLVRGWKTLVGAPASPFEPTLVLVVADADDARGLVHLFRPGMSVVIGGAASGGRSPLS